MMPIDVSSSFLATVSTFPQTLAYLDPGSGSMVLQVLLAGALSTMFFMKSWIRQVRDGLLIRNKKA
jgi:hypothetical protein